MRFAGVLMALRAHVMVCVLIVPFPARKLRMAHRRPQLKPGRGDGWLVRLARFAKGGRRTSAAEESWI
jgi:hypothetical protein